MRTIDICAANSSRSCPSEHGGLESGQPPYRQESALPAKRQWQHSRGPERSDANAFRSNRERAPPEPTALVLPDSAALPSSEDFNISPITVSQVLKAAWQSRRGNAVGLDEVPVEVLRVAAVAASVVPIMNGVLDGERAPAQGCKSLLLPVSKKPGTLRIEEHRGIAFMSCAVKIFKIFRSLPSSGTAPTERQAARTSPEIGR